jgi:hypothetical protein
LSFFGGTITRFEICHRSSFFGKMTTVRPSSPSSSIIIDPASSHGVTTSCEEPNLATMPEEVLLRLLQYVDDTHAHRNILALERTCRVFRTMLKDDNIWACLFSQSQCDEHEEYEYPPTNRERAFLRMSIDNIQRYQEGADNLLLKYLGGVDGVRSLTGKLLNAMKPTEDSLHPQIICSDAIGYLVEVIQCNVIDGLEKALLLTVEMLWPGDGFPTVTRRYVRVLGSCCSDMYRGYQYHECTRMARMWRGTILHGSLWKWPEHDCRDDEFLGGEERRKLVRALAYRAGIVKMSGDAFSFISTVILHEMAVLMSYASDICDGEQSYAAAYYPPLLITPHQIKDAVKLMGMQPILFGFKCSGVEWVEGDDAEYFTEDSESDDTFEFESACSEVDWVEDDDAEDFTEDSESDDTFEFESDPESDESDTES